MGERKGAMEGLVMKDIVLEKSNNRAAVRDSNIELLRIVAMIVIVASHLFYHGGIFKHFGENNMQLILGGVFFPAVR